MAFTMTLHNMPEGLAVAFSAYTGLGWIMALAIAMHNIPEGIIVAAPIYAATGSRLKALTIATLSGLSEPLGALLALLFVKPFLTMERLHLTMAFMGAPLPLEMLFLFAAWRSGRFHMTACAMALGDACLLSVVRQNGVCCHICCTVVCVQVVSCWPCAFSSSGLRRGSAKTIGAHGKELLWVPF